MERNLVQQHFLMAGTATSASSQEIILGKLDVFAVIRFPTMTGHARVRGRAGKLGLVCRSQIRGVSGGNRSGHSSEHRIIPFLIN